MPVKPKRSDPVAERWQFALHPAVRPDVCKLVYAEEWRQSIMESHHRGAGRDQALRSFHAELDSLRQSLDCIEDLVQGNEAPPEAAVEWL